MNIIENEIGRSRLGAEELETFAEGISNCQKPQKRFNAEDWCEDLESVTESWEPKKTVTIHEDWKGWQIVYVGTWPKKSPRELKIRKIESPNEAKFRRLADQWYRETEMLSMIHKKSMHPAYQRIIGMGKDALPFIFQEMKKNRGHWLWALSMIHGDDVAKPEQSLPEAINAWMKWGQDNGYV